MRGDFLRAPQTGVLVELSFAPALYYMVSSQVMVILVNEKYSEAPDGYYGARPCSRHFQAMRPIFWIPY